MSEFAFRVGMTVVWAFVLLCWCAVYVDNVPPAFGMAKWLFAVIHLVFWATVVGKVWKASKPA